MEVIYPAQTKALLKDWLANEAITPDKFNYTQIFTDKHTQQIIIVKGKPDTKLPSGAIAFQPPAGSPE